MPLTVDGIGPVVQGVQDGRNPDLPNTGLLRYARHAVLSGAGRLMVGPGSEVAMSFVDDQVTPAAVTSLCWVGPWKDGALVVGHSTVTNDAYLYHVDAEFTGWYDNAWAFTAASTAEPVGVLWSSLTEPPVVTVAEVLGTAYIAHNDAATAAALSHATRTFSGTSIADLSADLDGTGADPVYFLGTFAFQAHLWGWGYDQGTVASTAYRPDLLRFGGPIGGALDADGASSFAVGHRVGSAREAIVGVCVAGNVAYVGTSYSLWPITGFGRDSWDKSTPLDDSFGFASVHGAVSANGVCYYWSPRGPARVYGLNKPEPLWDAIPETVAAVRDPEKIVAAYDADRDQILWFVRRDADVRSIVAYDVRRECFVGVDTDFGVAVTHASLVTPVLRASAAPEDGPSAAPTNASTNNVGAVSARANWTNGDATATTRVEYRVQGSSSWIVAGDAVAGATFLTIGGLSSSIAYEWRCYHRKAGVSSTALGPSGATQFTTGTTLLAPTDIGAIPEPDGGSYTVFVSWTNGPDQPCKTRVFRDGAQIAEVAAGVGFVYDEGLTTGSYDYTCRHVQSGLTQSALTGPATAVVP